MAAAPESAGGLLKAWRRHAATPPALAVPLPLPCRGLINSPRSSLNELTPQRRPPPPPKHASSGGCGSGTAAGAQQEQQQERTPPLTSSFLFVRYD